MERVRESGYGDRIDRVVRSIFGVGRKTPPENFFGGGGGGRRWCSDVTYFVSSNLESQHEATLRFQEQLDKEQRQRIARAHEAASSFNIEEWEDIQARIEADEELAQRLQAVRVPT
ncbi:hypothetical protein Tco_1502369 [Tanacetum coccineum]